MREKKICKIITSSIMIIVIIFCMQNITYGGVVDIVNPNSGATGPMEKPIQILIGIFQVVALGVGTIMLISLAIKYMSSAPGDKAEIKQHAVIYLVGACIAFASSGLMQILKNFVNEAIK